MHVIDHFTLQYYLTKAILIKYKKQICRIRIIMSSHNLAIEQGRHTNTPINNRNCKLCKMSSILFWNVHISTTSDVNTLRSIIGKKLQFTNKFSCWVLKILKNYVILVVISNMLLKGVKFSVWLVSIL